MTKEEYYSQKDELLQKKIEIEIQLEDLFYQYHQSVTGLKEESLIRVDGLGDCYIYYNDVLESNTGKSVVLNDLDGRHEYEFTLKEFLKLNYTIINED